MSKPPRESFVLTLVDCGQPEDGPPILRLRGLLKRALRGFALKCVRVTAAKPPALEPPLTEEPKP